MARKIGVDTGGTFTDCIFVDDNGLTIAKVLSTPDNPARVAAACSGSMNNGRRIRPTSRRALYVLRNHCRWPGWQARFARFTCDPFVYDEYAQYSD